MRDKLSYSAAYRILHYHPAINRLVVSGDKLCCTATSELGRMRVN